MPKLHPCPACHTHPITLDPAKLGQVFRCDSCKQRIIVRQSTTFREPFYYLEAAERTH